MFRIFAKNNDLMKRMDTEKKQELVIYGILWGLVFLLVPAVIILQGLSNDPSFQVKELFRIWLRILPFFLLFFVHDLFVAPLLLEKRKAGLYAVAVAVLLIVFGGYIWNSRPVPPELPLSLERPDEGRKSPPPGGERRPSGRMPLTPELMRFMLGLLMLGVNLGVKFFLKAQRSERMMQQMKAENLEHQLETLRYQINPHFFMNTLNNIHALVDLDPEKARESILELSKMMRYILYEGNRPTIPLAQEADFLRHYVSLMRIRYPGEIRIDLSLPADCGEAEVPPLVFASSVENAFKHGISYEAESFVSIEVSCEDGRVVFRCSNSRHGAATGGGIGVHNVRKRLELLYDEDFTYTVEATESRYDIRMNLPASPGNHPAAV